jgi:hypothetical protein
MWSVPRVIRKTTGMTCLILQGRLRRDDAIIKLTVQLWSVNQRATA